MKHTILIFAFLLIWFPAQAKANIGYDIPYYDGETELMGYWADSQCNEAVPPPVILIVHQWKGITYHERQRAHRLAEMCYNVLVVDMYGKDVRPETTEEAKAQSSKYKNDPALARQRLKASLNFAKKKGRTSDAAIMGYCFGGTMALELARTGEPLTAAISFHGGLSTEAPSFEQNSIKTPILIHHGDADPYVSPEEVEKFLNEMREVNADWMFIRYADAVHSFTQRSAGYDPSTGSAYNKKADERSWDYTIEYLDMLFGRETDKLPY